MMRKLLRFACCLICLLAAFQAVQAQQIYDPKNVTQDVLTTHYDNLQPVTVMEYATDPGGSPLERRLEMLPENDLPYIKVRILDENLQETPFINQPPFNGLFDDGLTNFKLNVDAATLLLGTEVSLKVIKDKFGWTGINNQAGNGLPIVWNFIKPDKEVFSASPKFGIATKEFYFVSDGEQPEKINKIDAVAHEMFHAILNFKIGSPNFLETSLCSEQRMLRESLCDIIGLYVLNEYEQNSPALYQWTWSKGLLFPGRPFDNPNAAALPDTYYGNYYVNACPENADFPVHQNATVINHWYYLLATGTTGTETNDLGYSYKLNGIGINKAIQIVWKSVDYLSTKSDFEDLKKATLKATEQLYGLHSTEYLAAMDAWCAVGICDNNLGLFSMFPPHGQTDVESWPGVDANIIWEGKPVGKWQVEFATDVFFTQNVQTVEVKNFTTVIKPGGGTAFSGFATAYYHPGERVYVRASIIEADANFCKGYNPLCVLYQQYGPTHAFTLSNKQAKFWHTVPSDHWTANPWIDPTIVWKSGPNAQQYTYEVASDDAFTKIVYSANTPYTGNFSESGTIDHTVLEAGKTFYTRVRAERFNTPEIIDNFGTWSKTEEIKVPTPQTSILQALNQQANDPATPVSSLGFNVSWYPYPGTSNYVIQVATDDAFLNIIRSQTVSGNLTTSSFLLPSVANLTGLFVRVLPQKGPAFGFCNKVWRIITNQQLAVPAMKSPANGTTFPFHDFLATFTWTEGSLNKNLVAQYQLEITKTASNLTSIFTTPNLDLPIKDPLLFDGNFQVRVCGVNALGAKSALSAPFSYTVCPDHPAVSFPGDLGKVDSDKNFNIEWYPSESFAAGSQYLVTIMDPVSSIPIPGFNNKPTTNNFMLVPASTLTSGKSYLLTVKNSSSCAVIVLPQVFFNAVGSGGSNQPPKPKLVNFTIDLNGFRNDPDGLAWGTSNYRLGIELFDPDGNLLTLIDPNMDQVTHLDVDSENSGVIMTANNKPQGGYKLRLKMLDIFPPITYYPFDQPRFSVLLNGQSVVTNHVITIDLINPASTFNEFKVGFQFADITLDIK